MSKKELAILCILTGMIIGMSISLLLRYSIKMEEITTIINNSCYNSEINKLSISFFSITVKCKNGESNHYNILDLERNSSN